MNTNRTIVFDLQANHGEAAKWLATLVAEFQAKGVRFILEQDANLVYVTVQ